MTEQTNNTNENIPTIELISENVELEAVPTPALVLDSDESDTVPHEETALSVSEMKVEDLSEILTEDELKIVDDFANQIDLHNSNIIMQYGSAAQSKMASFTDEALSNVRTKDLGEIGGLLAGVTTELRSFDVDDNDKGFFGFLKRGGNKIESLRNKYDKAENNVNKIVKALENQQVTLMKDAAMLDKMYETNLVYFKELTMYIIAGKQKLEEVRKGELADLVAKANESGRPEDAQAARDLESMCNRFEKKLNDLALTRVISMQTAPQIRMVQNNEVVMVEKIQTTLVNTIPLWKNQMVLALGIANSTEAIKAQQEVTNTTNELLKKNAQMLHDSSVQIAKESERGIVDIETLKSTNDQLIKTFDEVLAIQEEGRKKRAEAEVEMAKIESELKAKLLEIQN